MEADISTIYSITNLIPISIPLHNSICVKEVPALTIPNWCQWEILYRKQRKLLYTATG